MVVIWAESEQCLDTIFERSNSELVVVKFGAKWCSPCQVFHTHFVQLAAEAFKKQSECTFVAIDKTDDTEPIFEKFEIAKIPTVLLFVGGEIKQRLPAPDPDTFRVQVFENTPRPRLVLDDDF